MIILKWTFGIVIGLLFLLVCMPIALGLGAALGVNAVMDVISNWENLHAEERSVIICIPLTLLILGALVVLSFF